MPEIGTSGSMSGEGKRSDAGRHKPPRPSSTLLRGSIAFYRFPTIAVIQCLGRLGPFWPEVATPNVVASTAGRAGVGQGRTTCEAG